ncbi:hypothetical protein [Luteitalea sp.]
MLAMDGNQNRPDQFRARLREGHFNELRVALFFMLRGHLARISFVPERYDVEVRAADGSTSHIEVKWDRRADQSGNLYFEIENTVQRAASGIVATTADQWCHVIGDGSEAILAPVENLRSLLRAGRFRAVNTNGPDSNSRGLLVPADVVRRHPGVETIRLPTVEDFFGVLFQGANSRRLVRE